MLKTDRRRIALTIFTVFAVTALVYSPTLRYGFVWDDELFVVANTSIRSWSSIPRYFTDYTTYGHGLVTGMYRPLRNISYLIDYKTAGLNATWFHAVNVLLHSLNACLLLYLCTLLLKFFVPMRAPHRHITAAAAATLLWAIHPVQTEAVAWIKGRDELLFTLFLLCATISWLKYVSSRGGRGLCGWSAVALYILALLSKEMALAYPLLMLLMWLKARDMGIRRSFPWGPFAAVAAVSIAFIAARHAVLGQTAQGDYLSGNLPDEMLTMTRAFKRYLVLVVFPHDLLADYSAFRISRSPFEPAVVLSLFLICGYVAACVALFRRASLAGLGLMWFGVALLPVSNVVPTMQFLAERFLYFPLIGLAIAAANLLVRFCSPGDGNIDTGQRQRLVVLVTAAVLVLYAALTWRRLPDWSSSSRLHMSTWRSSPASPRITLSYASALIQEHRFEEARPVLERMLAQNMQQYQWLVHGLYGLVLLQSGELDKAKEHLDRSIANNPVDAHTLGYLGYYYLAKGQPARAVQYYQRSLAINPFNDGVRKQHIEAQRRLSKS